MLIYSVIFRVYLRSVFLKISQSVDNVSYDSTEDRRNTAVDYDWIVLHRIVCPINFISVVLKVYKIQLEKVFSCISYEK